MPHSTSLRNLFGITANQTANSNQQYIHTWSNHPLNVKKQLPSMIAKHLSQNSSNKNEFEKAAPDYEEAFYKRVDTTSNCNMKRPRNSNQETEVEIHFGLTPPYNATVKTNLGKELFRLLIKHFPKQSPFHKLFNRNNVKSSYSCTPTMSFIIAFHNRELP